ncbi:uncharacterized protein LOC111694518 [Trichogramma pretiosum]|uniref:uncharacterized protein LOC111694518 n=1 Tax=Trichogramma pretiosum TaxID=7493 RepID=UPI000C719897|nr:uncharacterized protein LOC111694518 [Trichogramma pretiosum]
MAEESGRSSGGARIDCARIMAKNPKRMVFLIFKIVEVVLCDVAIGLSNYPFDDVQVRRNFFHNFTDIEGAIVFTSLYGYSLINVVLVVSYFLDEKLPKKMLMIFSSVAAILCCITGVILIVELGNHDYDLVPTEYIDQLLPSGCVAVLASLTFALDTLLTYKYI